MEFREMGCEVDGTGSGSIPMVGCGIGSVEPSDSTIRELVSFLVYLMILCQLY